MQCRFFRILPSPVLFFPLSIKSVDRDPADPASRIDREISERSRRLVLGSCLDEDLQSILSALVVVCGKGKYLRILNAVTCRRPVPEFTRKLLHEVVCADAETSMEDLRTVQQDIALVMASAIEELKGWAGKYVDRLLVLSVTEPELSVGNDDRTWSLVELTDTHLLAEQTGIPVISSFEKRDILAGGNGRNLDALPTWILFGDRSRTVASTDRILFTIGAQAKAFYLPASDGIDSKLPDIQIVKSDGLNRFRTTLNCFELEDLQTLNLDGSEISMEQADLDRQLELDKISRADFVRSSIVRLVDEISDRITSILPSSRIPGEIVIDAPHQVLGSIANQFRRRWAHARIYDGFGWEKNGCQLHPILAATLGVLSIDQLPANIPWITGAKSQKVLGTLTPGSPANWRQLLREMADFQPPVMRLRDAI